MNKQHNYVDSSSQCWRNEYLVICSLPAGQTIVVDDALSRKVSGCIESLRVQFEWISMEYTLH